MAELRPVCLIGCSSGARTQLQDRLRDLTSSYYRTHHAKILSACDAKAA
jgi:hypothetical protein